MTNSTNNPHPRPAEYRRRAEECVAIAQSVRTAEQRTMLLHIAETWLRLADEAVASVAEETGTPILISVPFR